MRRALLASIALLALLPAAAAAGETGVEGKVVDVTCPGPCRPGLDPRPFGGPAEVRIRSLPDHGLVATVPVKKSRFEAALEPGLYRARLVPYPDQPRPSCWHGSRRTFEVAGGERAHLRLKAQNVCIA